MHYLRPSNQNKFPIYIISESFLVQKKTLYQRGTKNFNKTKPHCPNDQWGFARFRPIHTMTTGFY